MSGIEKRRTPRVTLVTPVRVDTARGTFHGQGRDLSEGGIGVYLTKLPPLKSTVTLRFALPHREAEIEATGEVIYHQRGEAGSSDDWMGIHFLRMDADSQQAIRVYVKEHYDSSKPHVPGPPAPTGKKA